MSQMETERETGLRFAATRALCVIVVLAWCVWIATLVGAIYKFLIRREDELIALLDYLIVPWLCIAGLMLASIGMLWLWRRCDRCRRRLFHEGRHSWVRWWPGVDAFDRRWLQRQWLTPKQEPERDYRAKTLLGSYRNAAIVRMAFTGRLRCQWCGHEDGANPSYVITASE
jgi:hypothetical protein